MVTENDILDRLRNIIDPELEVNIVDLGLIYNININPEERRVDINMTLTAEGCPLSNVIKFEVEEVLKGLEGIDEATVNIVWQPKWDQSMIKLEALKKLSRH